jgi:hypothetical protein
MGDEWDRGGDDDTPVSTPDGSLGPEGSFGHAGGAVQHTDTWPKKWFWFSADTRGWRYYTENGKWYKMERRRNTHLNRVLLWPKYWKPDTNGWQRTGNSTGLTTLARCLCEGLPVTNITITQQTIQTRVSPIPARAQAQAQAQSRDDDPRLGPRLGPDDARLGPQQDPHLDPEYYEKGDDKLASNHADCGEPVLTHMDRFGKGWVMKVYVAELWAADQNIVARIVFPPNMRRMVSGSGLTQWLRSCRHRDPITEDDARVGTALVLLHAVKYISVNSLSARTAEGGSVYAPCLCDDNFRKLELLVDQVKLLLSIDSDSKKAEEDIAKMSELVYASLDRYIRKTTGIVPKVPNPVPIDGEADLCRKYKTARTGTRTGTRTRILDEQLSDFITKVSA